MTTTTTLGEQQVPTASPLAAARVLAGVVLPVAARGAIARRPRATALAQRLDADHRAVQLLQRMRTRYGAGPLQLRLPGRRFVLVLDPTHVHRVLHGSPEVFTLATREKRGALEHFQPEGVLVSTPEQRRIRKPFNDQVLDSGNPLHRLAGPMSAAVSQEMAIVLGIAERRGQLTWDDFSTGWWRAVRRVVLGDAARDDHELTDLLLRLRRRANYTFLAPRSRTLRRQFTDRLAAHLERAEPGSLSALVASTPAAPGTQPHQQVPQWLFAFDATAWATFRALALLSSSPPAVQRARAELERAPDLPWLRACLLESLRLWPTTPAILRDTLVETRWETGTLPTGASVLLYAPLFHRDQEHLPEADRFAPELWLRERTEHDWPLVPFSAGPGMCPGRNVVLLTASTALAGLVRSHDWTTAGADLRPDGPLPGTLSPFGLRFTPRPATG